MAYKAFSLFFLCGLLSASVLASDDRPASESESSESESSGGYAASGTSSENEEFSYEEAHKNYVIAKESAGTDERYRDVFEQLDEVRKIIIEEYPVLKNRFKSCKPTGHAVGELLEKHAALQSKFIEFHRACEGYCSRLRGASSHEDVGVLSRLAAHLWLVGKRIRSTRRHDFPTFKEQCGSFCEGIKDDFKALVSQSEEYFTAFDAATDGPSSSKRSRVPEE